MHMYVHTIQLPLPQDWINAHSRLVKYQQFRFVQQDHGQTHASLLATAEIFHLPRTIWQIQKFQQKFRAVIDIAAGHSRNRAEVD